MRGDDTNAAVRIGNRTFEDREEMCSTLLVFDEREQLLELVENQHELRPVIGKDPLQRANQAALALLELLDQARRWLVRHPEQRRLELLQGIGARNHLHDPPQLGTVERAAAERRDESRADDRGLAASAGSHDGQEPRLRKPLDEVLDQRFSTEEIGG